VPFVTTTTPGAGQFWDSAYNGLATCWHRRRPDGDWRPDRRRAGLATRRGSTRPTRRAPLAYAAALAVDGIRWSLRGPVRQLRATASAPTRGRPRRGLPAQPALVLPEAALPGRRVQVCGFQDSRTCW
jgi:hypothetical protein